MSEKDDMIANPASLLAALYDVSEDKLRHG